MAVAGDRERNRRLFGETAEVAEVPPGLKRRVVRVVDQEHVRRCRQRHLDGLPPFTLPQIVVHPPQFYASRRRNMRSYSPHCQPPSRAGLPLDVALAVVPCSTKTAKPEFCLRPRAGISTIEPDVPPLDDDRVGGMTMQALPLRPAQACLLPPLPDSTPVKGGKYVSHWKLRGPTACHMGNYRERLQRGRAHGATRTSTWLLAPGV